MRLTITPTLPFDFDLSAKIFSDGDKQICKYANGKYWRVIRVSNKLMLCTVKSIGEVDKPKLLVELKTNESISENDKKTARQIICSLFDLKLDLNPFYNSVKNDEVMSKLTQELRGLKSPTTPSVFEALIYSIIEQQISLNVAFSIEKKFIKKFGESVKIEDDIYYAFPTPKRLAFANIKEFRACGLSQKKAEYVKEISKLVIKKKLELEKFKKYGEKSKIIEELCKIRGIGVWTAELTMVRGMHKLDAVPADDLGLRRCISHYYCKDRKISGEEAREIAKKWGDWQGLASFYLIMAGRLGVKV
ncbi:MAG: DNA-3-methyladenine glycosylase 2 family protein [Candidatus Aenigmarchaeota archaeon]|nr:DNA-3-methyladenine glycosylase 2 family protein [Candidatus Aenigmarchaeota archaeon]